MAKRSSCGPIASWTLAQTSSLKTWSLSEMYFAVAPHFHGSYFYSINCQIVYNPFNALRSRVHVLLKQKLKVPFAENPELSEVPLKPGIGLNIATLASPTARKFSLSCFYLPGLFNFFPSQNIFPIFSSRLMWLTPVPA